MSKMWARVPLRTLLVSSALGFGLVAIAPASYAVCPGGGGGGGSPPSDGNSIRFGTFNTAFVPNTLGLTDDLGKGIGGCPTDMWGDQDFECRTGKMIPKIIASNYDVIVLNEAFDEDARELLVAGLAGTYPYYIEKMDDGDFDGDSGLMLFSKWPFDRMVDADSNCIPVGETQYQPRDGGPALGFKGFGDLTKWPDSQANKGVGFVRLLSPSGRRYAIFFTHLQASYYTRNSALTSGWAAFHDGYDYQTDWLNDIHLRQDQMRVIANFARCLHNDPSEVVLVAGDLNIVGDMSNPYGRTDKYEVQTLGAYRKHNRYEWDELFNKSQPAQSDVDDFFWTTVEDAWAYQMTPTLCQPVYRQLTDPACQAADDQGNLNALFGDAHYDRGFTWADFSSEERLDYVLVGSPLDASSKRELCVQHMTQAWNLNVGTEFEGGMSSSTDLGGAQPNSDHMGLNAEINLAGDYCNPTGAYVDPPSGTPLRLANRGAVQWIKLTAPGTYTLNVNPASRTIPGADNEIDFRVYQPTDLSRPVVPYKGEVMTVPPVTCHIIPKIVGESDADPPCIDQPGFTDRKFKVAEAPLYIKVFHRGDVYSPSYTGDYRIYYHRNVCTSQNDACDVLPYETKEGIDAQLFDYPASAPATMWFSVQVEAPDANFPQSLRLFVTEPGGTQHIEGFDVVKDDGVTPALVVTNGTATPVVGTSVPYANGSSWEFRDESGALDKFGNSSGRDQKYYIRVHRLLGQSTSTESFKFWFGWETSLTWLYGPERGGVVCDVSCNDTQEWGEDEIYMRIEVDGVSFPRKVAPPGDAQSGVLVYSQFDEGESVEWSTRVFPQLGTNTSNVPISQQKGLKFVRSIKLELIEDDPENDETSSPIEFTPLGPQVKPAVKAGQQWSFGDDNYYQNNGINLAHHSPGKRCGSDGDCSAPTRCVGSLCR